MKIRLKTREGELVHEAEIPPFNERPAVILWGNRTFIPIEPCAPHSDETDSSIPYDQERTVYIECFGYYLADVPNPNRVGDSIPHSYRGEGNNDIG